MKKKRSNNATNIKDLVDTVFLVGLSFVVFAVGVVYHSDVGILKIFSIAGLIIGCLGIFAGGLFLFIEVIEIIKLKFSKTNSYAQIGCCIIFGVGYYQFFSWVIKKFLLGA